MLASQHKFCRGTTEKGLPGNALPMSMPSDCTFAACEMLLMIFSMSCLAFGRLCCLATWQICRHVKGDARQAHTLHYGPSAILRVNLPKAGGYSHLGFWVMPVNLFILCHPFRAYQYLMSRNLSTSQESRGQDLQHLTALAAGLI